MEPIFKTAPHEKPSHNTSMLDEVLAIGKKAVDSVEHHPRVSGATALAFGAVALAVATRGESNRVESVAEAAEEGAAVLKKAARFAPVDNYATGRNMILGVAGGMTAIFMMPVGFALMDLTRVNFYKSAEQCKTTSKLADCDKDFNSATNLHEQIALKFLSEAQCQSATAFICSANPEDVQNGIPVYRPKMEGFMTVNDGSKIAYPVYRDVDGKDFYSTSGVSLGKTTGAVEVIGSSLQNLSRSSVSCTVLVGSKIRYETKAHCPLPS